MAIALRTATRFVNMAHLLSLGADLKLLSIQTLAGCPGSATSREHDPVIPAIHPQARLAGTRLAQGIAAYEADGGNHKAANAARVIALTGWHKEEVVALWAARDRF
jgi:hypothetical protein